MSTNEEIGARLQAERLRLRLTQAEMAAFGGVSKTTQSNYETGYRVPDAMYLSQVAQRGVDVQFVVTRERTLTLEEARTAYLVARLSHEDASAALHVAEGRAGYLRQDTASVTASWLKQRQLKPEQLRYLVVSDTAMQPVLQEGDTLLVDVEDTQPKSGPMFVLRQGGELMVKYLQALPGGRTRVFGANAVFPAYEVDLQSMDVQVLGRVVASVHNW